MAQIVFGLLVGRDHVEAVHAPVQRHAQQAKLACHRADVRLRSAQMLQPQHRLARVLATGLPGRRRALDERRPGGRLRGQAVRLVVNFDAGAAAHAPAKSSTLRSPRWLSGQRCACNSARAAAASCGAAARASVSSKLYITNAPFADFSLVAARTRPELRPDVISQFIVELPNPGVVIHKLRKEGIRASQTGLIHIEDTFVPEDSLLGGQEGSYPLILECLSENRVGGAGIRQQYAVGRIHRDALVYVIGEGTSEVQRYIIARSQGVKP